MRKAEMAAPRISVVIPVHNAEGTLTRALQSVRAQTLAPLDIICVDDGSSDASVAMAQTWANGQGVPLRWLRNRQPRGPGAARNQGLAAADGEFIAFLDADDAWHADKLRLQCRALQTGGWDLLGGHSRLGAFDAASVDAALQPTAVPLWRAMLSNPFHTSSVIARNGAALRFPESGRASEDYALWLELLARGWRCGQHAQPLSAMFKPAYGHAGLSANLLRMQAGELAVLWRLGTQGHALLASVAIPWSCAKWLRRMLVTRLRP
jgi:glycosyltransferase involved in cell wall biosynthesis